MSQVVSIIASYAAECIAACVVLRGVCRILDEQVRLAWWRSQVSLAAVSAEIKLHAQNRHDTRAAARVARKEGE